MPGERRLTSIKQLVNDMLFHNDITGTITIDEITNTVTVQLVEPVTIDGTIAVSSIGGTVTTSTTITNNPLNVDNYPRAHVRTITQTTILVSNVSIVALAANPNRKAVFFKNWSNAATAPIIIHFGASPATSTNGAPITAGESWIPPDGVIDTSEVRVISTTASNKELYIEEWT